MYNVVRRNVATIDWPDLPEEAKDLVAKWIKECHVPPHMAKEAYLELSMVVESDVFDDEESDKILAFCKDNNLNPASTLILFNW